MQHYCQIETPKGVMRGYFHQPNVNKCPVCIIFHGFTGQKTGTKFSYVQLSRLLEAKGIATMRMDFLGSGESDLTFKDMTFKDELSCARVILEEVLHMPITSEVYILGHSMGGAIASELAKLYPQDIKKMCLWAPAFFMKEAVLHMVKDAPLYKEGIYDYFGFELSTKFVEDIKERDFSKDMDVYKNELLIIHGTKDETVPYYVSENYSKLLHLGYVLHPIEGGSHNFDKLDDIKEVMSLTMNFFSLK